MILQQLTHGAVARRKARPAVVIHIVNRRGALQKEMTIIPSPGGYVIVPLVMTGPFEFV